MRWINGYRRRLEALFREPAHPYTRALLEAVPRLGRDGDRLSVEIPGRVPEFGALPSGCSFHPRCAAAFEPCGRRAPALEDLGGGRRARCFLHAAERADPPASLESSDLSDLSDLSDFPAPSDPEEKEPRRR